ncbi:hypothetical protein OG455_39890 [Kitasatospora sp. NBC_01287]|uniref:DUF6059 family protein n=1 Tax=Kitasatospora sp. NBC_01287 TaxID=2903573 RepID=UPI002250B82E|nr:DUF6059 family protein [Kitasatospora sp. NBC_01287]MCX4751599.1 hypothetical protein [Kitasatospora sp. NBC_01287]
MLRPLRTLARRCLRDCWQALVLYGAVATQTQPPPQSSQLPRSPQPPGSLPGPGHPERLCPEQPLSPLERLLDRELRIG